MRKDEAYGSGWLCRGNGWLSETENHSVEITNGCRN